jgi:hypothetical protein
MQNIIKSKALDEIYERTISDLIKSEDWESLNIHINEVPEKIIQFSSRIENILQNEKYLNPILEKEKIKIPADELRYYNRNYIYPKELTRPYEIVFKLLNFRDNIFSEDFINSIIKKIILKIDDDFNSQHLNLFIRALGKKIILNEKDYFIKNTQILSSLSRYYPEKLGNFFPEIVEKCVEIGFFVIAFKVVKANHFIIKEFEKEAKIVIKYLDLNPTQSDILRNIILENNLSLLEEFNFHKKKIKNDFLENISNLPKNREWFTQKNHYTYFSSQISLYSIDELKEVIGKLIKLDIPLNNSNKSINWINMCLLGIAWSNKSDLISSYYKELIRLKYTQVVFHYFHKNPVDIDQLSLEELIKIDFINNELLKTHFEVLKKKFTIDTLFRSYLCKSHSEQQVILFFWKKCPEKIEDFSKFLVKLIVKMDFSLNFQNFDKFPFNPHVAQGILFNELYLPYPAPFFSNDQIERKLNELFSNDDNRSMFFLYGEKIPKIFGEFKEHLQEKLISHNIENQNWRFFINMAKYSLDSIKPVLFSIFREIGSIKENSKNFIYFIRILLIQSINKDTIFKYIWEKLDLIESSYEKAQILTYFSHYEQSLEIYVELLDSNLSYSELIFIYLDYVSASLFLQNSTLDIVFIEDLLYDLNNLKESYNNTQLNKKKKSRLNFKFENLAAQLFFRKAELYMDNYEYSTAIEFFTKAKKRFFSSKSLKISEDVKTELENYEMICKYYILELIPVIKNLRTKDNRLCEKRIDIIKKNIIGKIAGNKPKIIRLRKSIQNLNLSNDGILSSLNLEQTATFCPLFPSIQQIILINSNEEVIFLWNSNLKTVSEPLKITKESNSFTLIINFKDIVDPSTFNLENNQSKLIQFEKKRNSNQKSKNIDFLIDISVLIPFNGIREISFSLINILTSCQAPIRFDLQIECDFSYNRTRVDDVFTLLWGKFSKIKIEEDNIAKVQNFYTKDIEILLAKYFRNHNLIPESCKAHLDTEVKKAHTGGEVADFIIDLNYNNELVTISIPIKSAREIGRQKIEKIAEKNIYEFINPSINFGIDSFTFAILLANKTPALISTIQGYKNMFSINFAYIDLEGFTRLLKRENFI